MMHQRDHVLYLGGLLLFLAFFLLGSVWVEAHADGGGYSSEDGHFYLGFPRNWTPLEGETLTYFLKTRKLRDKPVAVFVENPNDPLMIPDMEIYRYKGISAFSFESFAKQSVKPLEEAGLTNSNADTLDFSDLADEKAYFTDPEQNAVFFAQTYEITGQAGYTQLGAIFLGKKECVTVVLLFPEHQLAEHARLFDAIVESFEYEEGYQFNEHAVSWLARYGDWLETIIQVSVFIILISLGFFVGTFIETRHYASIRQRERELLHLPAVPMDLKAALGDKPVEILSTEMVSGAVVLSEDYFKGFIAMLQNFFGGNLTPYESLMDRARREASLRMKEKAIGADIIVNTRFETCTIGRQSRRDRGASAIEVFCYGTAVTIKRPPSTQASHAELHA